jgi:sugar/nucleoside kinase (ribokinase family)
VLVACLGDIMLDVIVDAPDGIVPDDDTPARITFAPGGQAANVAGWAVEHGARARLYGPRATHGPARYVGEALTAAGIEVHGPRTGRSGAVVSLVSGGGRSLASDPGTSAWLDQVAPGPWLEGAGWLFVSGYALLRAARPDAVLETAAAARAAGTRVAVDLASATLIRGYGAARFRALWHSLEPDVVLANGQEWQATHEADGRARRDHRPPAFGAGGRTVLVLKQGPRGCSFVIDGVVDHRPAVPGPVLDPTGAGDALTAGFLLGGPDLAMRLAARCVSQVGAQPRGILPGART